MRQHKILTFSLVIILVVSFSVLQPVNAASAYYDVFINHNFLTVGDFMRSVYLPASGYDGSYIIDTTVAAQFNTGYSSSFDFETRYFPLQMFKITNSLYDFPVSKNGSDLGEYHSSGEGYLHACVDYLHDYYSSLGCTNLTRLDSHFTTYCGAFAVGEGLYSSFDIFYNNDDFRSHAGDKYSILVCVSKYNDGYLETQFLIPNDRIFTDYTSRFASEYYSGNYGSSYPGVVALVDNYVDGYLSTLLYSIDNSGSSSYTSCGLFPTANISKTRGAASPIYSRQLVINADGSLKSASVYTCGVNSYIVNDLNRGVSDPVFVICPVPIGYANNTLYSSSQDFYYASSFPIFKFPGNISSMPNSNSNFFYFPSSVLSYRLKGFHLFQNASYQRGLDANYLNIIKGPYGSDIPIPTPTSVPSTPLPTATPTPIPYPSGVNPITPPASTPEPWQPTVAPNLPTYVPIIITQSPSGPTPTVAPVTGFSFDWLFNSNDIDRTSEYVFDSDVSVDDFDVSWFDVIFNSLGQYRNLLIIPAVVGLAVYVVRRWM